MTNRDQGQARGPGRRTVLCGLAAAWLVPAGQGAALNQPEAAALIDTVVGEINTVINSGGSETQMIARFEKIFARYCDVSIIAQSALGVDARTASAGQMAAFTDAFRGYIARKYGRRFREFAGGRIEVQATRPVKSFYEVKTTAYIPSSAPIEVVFLVSDRSGRNLFFNIVVEGVNMLTAERGEIRAMLDKHRGNLDRLIEDLRQIG